MNAKCCHKIVLAAIISALVSLCFSQVDFIEHSIDNDPNPRSVYAEDIDSDGDIDVPGELNQVKKIVLVK